MRKIPMGNPIVEMNGDEMARVIWGWIKEELLNPYLELNTVYIDLGIRSRDESDDEVTLRAVDALQRYKVGVKCPTITPNRERMKEYQLRRLLPSPNATIRSRLRGTIFRAPITVDRIRPAVRGWSRPIVIARHGVGDIYEAVELEQSPGDHLAIYVNGAPAKEIKADERSVGVFYSLTERSVIDFARAVFGYALERGMDVWLSAKDTILKKYDGLYKEVFDRVYESEFRRKFERRGISYHYYLIDDAYARAVRSAGGFVWALKNYDGDVASDFVMASFSGSLALSTSELYSPDGVYYSEASHGTVQKHYYRYLRGETPYTNPVGLILAWAKALGRRGAIDGNHELLAFSEALMASVKEVIDQGGYGTPDIANLADPPLRVVSTAEFIRMVKERLEPKLL